MRQERRAAEAVVRNSFHTTWRERQIANAIEFLGDPTGNAVKDFAPAPQGTLNTGPYSNAIIGDEVRPRGANRSQQNVRIPFSVRRRNLSRLQNASD